jgi:hypothetical protein
MNRSTSGRVSCVGRLRLDDIKQDNWLIISGLLPVIRPPRILPWRALFYRNLGLFVIV